jgi:predicted permease
MNMFNSRALFPALLFHHVLRTSKSKLLLAFDLLALASVIILLYLFIKSRSSQSRTGRLNLVVSEIIADYC